MTRFILVTGLADNTARMIRAEQTVTAKLQLSTAVIPGLLQSEAYAKMAIGSGGQWRTSEEIRHLVDLRLARQEVLSETGRFTFIINEIALRHPFGTLADRTEQLWKIIRAAQQPNVRVQVAYARWGLAPGIGLDFELLRTEQETMVHFETAVGSELVTDSSQIDAYQELFERAKNQAMHQCHSLEFLLTLARELNPDKRKTAIPA